MLPRSRENDVWSWIVHLKFRDLNIGPHRYWKPPRQIKKSQSLEFHSNYRIKDTELIPNYLRKIRKNRPESSGKFLLINVTPSGKLIGNPVTVT